MERDQAASSFSTPSPGEILKRQARRGIVKTGAATVARGGAEPATVPAGVFEPGHRVAANRERGVLLAPMLVSWHYTVDDAEAFAKWLRMKEIILSDARFALVEALQGAHYFGTYISSACARPADGLAAGDVTESGTTCQTLWGFSRREAMEHLFELGHGTVPRKAIVETDTAEFLAGLKGFIRTGGGRFRQSVFVSPQVM